MYYKFRYVFFVDSLKYKLDIKAIAIGGSVPKMGYLRFGVCLKKVQVENNWQPLWWINQIILY